MKTRTKNANTKNSINRTQTIGVNLNMGSFLMARLRQGAKANKCSVQEAAQYLVDLDPDECIGENLCDWSNDEFPMPKSAKRPTGA